ncbi:MAG: ATP-binding protein [Actinomycetes bacterium]
MSAVRIPRAVGFVPPDLPRLVSVTRRSVLVQAGVAAVYVLAVGPRDAPSPGTWLVLGVGLLLALALQPWRPPDEVRLPWWAVYLWFTVAFVAMAVWLGGAAPGPPLLWVVLWSLVAVNVGFALPPAGRVVCDAQALLALVAGLLLRGAPAGDVLLASGWFVLTVVLVARQAAAERVAADAAGEARHQAEVRVHLLAGLARVNQLDVVTAADAAVTTMLELGFRMALVGRVDEDAGTMQALSAIGFEDVTFLGEVLDIGDGLAGEAIAARALVSVPDYASYPRRLPGRTGLGATVAVPVLVEGRVVACVHGARAEVGEIPASQLEVIEVLAVQLARVFAMADRYDRERELAAELAELDRMKRRFITSVSHELRTPMTLLQGFGETLRRHGSRLSVEERMLVLERLLANGARLDRLITSLLDLSRVEGGHLEVRPEAVLLEPLVREVLAGLDPLADGHRVRLDLRASLVDADPVLVGHVLRHLVGNAMMHTPAGTLVVVSSRRVGDEVRIEVVDDGPGIPPERLAHVAERFYRAAPVADQRGGLGIGLALVRAILEAHGSHLQLTAAADPDGAGGPGSARSPGLRAWFSLPAPTGEPADRPHVATGVRSRR